MIITENSPLLRLRSDIAPEQASFLDGIRICGQMLDVSYYRLEQLLWELADPSNQDPRAIRTAETMLDAWSIIDSIHRLRHLLDQLPRFKKSGTKYQLFSRSTARATKFRDTIQHLRGELINMGKNGWPSWGTLCWLAVIDHERKLVRSCALIPGRVLTYRQTLINPFNLELNVRSIIFA